VRRLIFATAVGVVLLNSAPALAADSATPANDDPWEHLNRRVYSFNEGLDRAIIRPAAMAYSHLVPSPLRIGIRNVLSNVGEPPVIINDILQARFKRAGKETGRFLLNSTAGVGGLFDVATGAGLDHEGTNFAITLGRYGVKTGPYIYLPVVGPSTVRGVIGTAVGGALDPLYWIRYPHKASISLGRAVVSGLDLRAESDGALKTLVSDATDPYATIRSAYLQNLQSQINGDTTPVQALPDFDDTTSPPPATPKAGAPGDQTLGDKAAPSAAAPISPPAPSPASPPNSPAPGADDGE
jgi:phospholipid-binding lipoprotein MlaA